MVTLAQKATSNPDEPLSKEPLQVFEELELVDELLATMGLLG